jgi:hypothetical protein
LARSLELELGSEEKSREWRKSLGREDAKALVGLRQRWATGGGKGKGREMGEAWVERVAELVRLVSLRLTFSPGHALTIYDE